MLKVIGDAFLLIKAVFSTKERARLRAMRRGQVAAAIFLGIAAWTFFLPGLGYFGAAVLAAS